MEALDSKEYLIQCLAIYLIGKSGDDRHLHALARFYRRPVGEKLDRLEKKSLDALLEGFETVLRRARPQVAERSEQPRPNVALTIAQDRMLIVGHGDIVSLVLIDPKTRAKAAATVLLFEAEGSLRLVPDDPTAEPVAQLCKSAKQDALQATLTQLMRDESPSVREVAVKLVPFLKEPAGLAASVRRLAVEDRSSSVQAAALRALARVDRSRLVPVLIEVFTDVGARPRATSSMSPQASWRSISIKRRSPPSTKGSGPKKSNGTQRSTASRARSSGGGTICKATG